MINSDKYYWHGYLTEYERLAFSKISPYPNILEFGVGEGGSIAFLLERFQTAKIVAVDIVPERKGWIKNPRVVYYVADQRFQKEYKNLFSVVDSYFDLIIDDGSHTPHDQALCLTESFYRVKDSRFYILEDVHTSYAARHEKINAFHILLTIQHLLVSSLQLTDEIVSSLTTNSYFNEEQIKYLYDNISSIYLFKRTALPLFCYNCRSNSFDYANLKCKCGVSLYQEADSMSFIIRKVSRNPTI